MPTDKPTVLVTLEPTEDRALRRLSRRYGLTRPQVLRQLLRAEVSREREGRTLRLPGGGSDDGMEAGTGAVDR